jgi:hypothetical protein
VLRIRINFFLIRIQTNFFQIPKYRQFFARRCTNKIEVLTCACAKTWVVLLFMMITTSYGWIQIRILIRIRVHQKVKDSFRSATLIQWILVKIYFCIRLSIRIRISTRNQIQQKCLDPRRFSKASFSASASQFKVPVEIVGKPVKIVQTDDVPVLGSCIIFMQLRVKILMRHQLPVLFWHTGTASQNL